MDTAKLAGLIISVGAVLPLLTSIVQQGHWSNRTRTIVGVIISALAGLVTYVTQYGLDLSNPGALVATVLGVILAAGAAYQTVWKPSGLAPTLEAKTSPAPVTADPAAVEGDDEDSPEIDTIEAPDVDAPPAEEDLPVPPGFDDGSDRVG